MSVTHMIILYKYGQHFSPYFLKNYLYSFF